MDSRKAKIALVVVLLLGVVAMVAWNWSSIVGPRPGPVGGTARSTADPGVDAAADEERDVGTRRVAPGGR